jgi:F0F1-type ATP synthase delta subunit
MKAPRRQLAYVIATRTLDGSFDAKEIRSLAAYLLDEGRTGELSSLMRDVQQAWADRGTVEVVASAAHTLPDMAKREIEVLARRIYPQAKRIIITQRLEPSLIGGVRLSLASYQLDRTAKGQLQQLKTLVFEGKE